MTLYVINDQIKFRSGHNKLFLQDSDNKTKMTYPAAKCLEIMLEQQGNIVTHAELYQKVWEAQGINVPPNTLYQNISIIRRALKEMISDGDKLIKTIPRKGFQIHPDAVVKRMKANDLQLPENNTVLTGNAMQDLSEPVGDSAHDKLHAIIGVSFFSHVAKILSSLSLFSQRCFR